jgi:N-acetylglucosamine malate deacetylase 1
MDNVFVICAHSDDQIIGPGGTLAKYAREGKNIYTIIFSYGELSHPWFKEQIASKMRINEAKEADKIIQGKGVFCLGLSEGKFEQEFTKEAKQKLLDILKTYPPTMVFTHSEDDPLGDHRAINKIVQQLADENHLTCPIYSFDIWNIFDFKKNKYPKMIVDISSTFSIKTKALKIFKSQILTMVSLFWSVYLKAFLYGLKYGKRFAEVFYKIR